MRLAEFAGRRVALWGFGREGRSTYRALRRVLPGLPLTVLDDAHLPPEASDVRIVSGRDAVATVLSDTVLSDTVLGDFDVIVKSPGISLYRPEVLEAKRRGVHVTSATRIWFAEHPDARVVCVTGTKGKSTTASLVAHLLRAAGVVAELRGNVGRPLLDPPDVEPKVWVIEISSYQAADLVADPSVAVLLNLFPEHLDWHGDVETYYRDKLRLFAHQRRGVAVVNRADPVSLGFSETFQRPVYFNDPRGFHVAGGAVRDGEREVLPVARIALPGAHNHGNVCAALAAVRCLLPEIDPASLVPAVESFRSLPHRLMPLGERDGVLYVDDSISTTPQSTMAALATFADRPVTVLVGGYERHLDYDELARELVTRPVHAVVTLPPSGARIAGAVRRELGASAGPPALIEAADLEEAVAAARRVTPAGGVVLLSPAAPSYGAFRNFEERGEAFAREAGFS